MSTYYVPDRTMPHFHFLLCVSYWRGYFVVHISHLHTDAMPWKHFNILTHHCLFVRGIHRSPVDSPHKAPVPQSFDASFHVHLNKPLNKHSSWRWFEKPWRSCDVTIMLPCFSESTVNMGWMLRSALCGLLVGMFLQWPLPRLPSEVIQWKQGGHYFTYQNYDIFYKGTIGTRLLMKHV